MTYCIICEKLTEDVKEEREWSRIFKVIVVQCKECGHFKYQYLEKEGEISSGK